MTPTSPFGPSIDQILVSTIAIIHTSLFSASVMGSSLILKVVASKKIANSAAEVGLTICFTSAEDSVLPFIHAGTESNFCKYCHKMMSDDSRTYLSPEDRPKFCSAHCEREYEWDENAYRARRFARNALKTIPGNSPSSNNIPQRVSLDSSDYHNALDNAIRALEDSAC
jgi:hypothetical protein